MEMTPKTSYIAWDTETTGKYEDDALDIDAPHIVQIAAVKYRNDKEVDSLVLIIRLPDGVHSTEGAVAVHGITDEYVAQNGIPFDAAWEKFQSFVSDDVTMVAHNNKFDERVLRANLKRFKHGDEFFKTKTMQCTLKLRRQKQFCDGKLSQIYEEFFNTPLEDAHDALVDSRAVGVIYPILRDYSYVHRDVGIKEVCINASDVDVACANFYGRSMADKLVNSLWRKYDPGTFQGDRDDDILSRYASVIDEITRDTSEKPSQCVKRPQYSHLSAYERYIIHSHVTLQRWKRLPKVKFPGIVENTRMFRMYLCTIETTRYYITGRPYALVHEGGRIKMVWPKYRTQGFEGARDSELLTAQVYMKMIGNCDEVRIIEIFDGHHRALTPIKQSLEQWEEIKTGVKHFASYFHNKLSLASTR